MKEVSLKTSHHSNYNYTNGMYSRVLSLPAHSITVPLFTPLWSSLAVLTFYTNLILTFTTFEHVWKGDMIWTNFLMYNIDHKTQRHFCNECCRPYTQGHICRPQQPKINCLLWTTLKVVSVFVPDSHRAECSMTLCSLFTALVSSSTDSNQTLTCWVYTKR